MSNENKSSLLKLKKMLPKCKSFGKKNSYIEYVSKETGWTYKDAKTAMDLAKEDGFSYKYYAKRKIWTKTEKEYRQAVKNIKIVNERNLAEKEHYMQEVCNATGWDSGEAMQRFREANQNCDCSYKDYWMLRLFEKSPAEQKEYLTLGVAEKLGFQYNKNPETLKTLLHKDRFAKMFTDLFNRKWFINRNLSYEEFLEKTDGVEDLICKPFSATQGKGVEKIHCGSDVSDKKAIYDKLMAMPRKMICEECIIQHSALAAFNPTSVNTIRVLTIVKDGKCHHVYAGFRMGRGKIVDNFHAGGIIASVDVKTGITCMDAIDLEGNHYPVHPISQLPTLGFQIPHWDEVLKVTEKAALRLDGVQMVGWDIAVTETGVCLIEGNSQASYMIIQLPYVESGIGMKKIFEPFIEG